MNSPAATVCGGGASVTAIIPTYNRANYLGTAISSVLAQDYPPVQVIVVDDGSNDNTREIVAEFASPVEYVAKENGGKSSALNLGLRNATGKLIWIFDDDDIAEPDALRKLVIALQENPSCGFAYGGYDLFAMEEGKMQKVPVRFPAVRPEDLYLAIMERSFVLQQGMLVRKHCYEQVGSFDENLIRSQDLDMMLRLARRFSGVKVPGIMFHHRQHTGVRGSKASPVLAKRSVEGWVKSDREIFGRIYATHALRDFLPYRPCPGELNEEQRFTCLLQR
ncbi:MAG: glycosyltransferase family 2 protein, partial [Acidobacteriaceae bacterium]|nr:glycosyltransferase family 2 protein [Acidobacteriaceae bacterium]